MSVSILVLCSHPVLIINEEIKYSLGEMNGERSCDFWHFMKYKNDTFSSSKYYVMLLCIRMSEMSVSQFFLCSLRVLKINEGIEYGLGAMNWEMVAALFGGWFLVYMIVWRGLHQSGYIIWFTALFPYTVMLTLLVKALTLPGAIDGLRAYVNVSKSLS